MRTIDEIQQAIAADFMNNESVAETFNFKVGDKFSEKFSRISIINILFYTFAVAVWVIESMFDVHKKEIEDRIEQSLAHRPKWYRDKVLNFMLGVELIEDSDKYDTSEMSDDDINKAHIVKHAVAIESEQLSILTIKVAGETKDGVRSPITANADEEATLAQYLDKIKDAETKLAEYISHCTDGGADLAKYIANKEEAEEKLAKYIANKEEAEEKLAEYIYQIKDAGVRINLVNMEPDIFNCILDIYYNPVLLPENVKSICQSVIKKYIENLPFNGVYTNMGLIDALQNVAGVKIVELHDPTTQSSTSTVGVPINAKHTPEAGYFVAGNVKLNMIPYE